MKTYKIKVQKKIFETQNSCSFILNIPKEFKKDFLFKPGQFLTLFLNLNQKKLRRSYSIPSSPLMKETFKITVKKIKNGLASTHLVDHVKKNEILETSKPRGNFFKSPTDSNPKHYILFAAGSGITPIFSILKSVLILNPKNKVTLIYSNRNENEIIYRKEIKNLCKKYLHQLKVIHCLSQKEPLSNSKFQKLKLQKKDLKNIKLKNRFNEDLLEIFLEENKKDPHFKDLETHYYLCGPIKYMKLIQDVLIRKNTPRNKIFKEVFSSPLNVDTKSNVYFLDQKKNTQSKESEKENLSSKKTESSCGSGCGCSPNKNLSENQKENLSSEKKESACGSGCGCSSNKNFSENKKEGCCGSGCGCSSNKNLSENQKENLSPKKKESGCGSGCGCSSNKNSSENQKEGCCGSGCGCSSNKDSFENQKEKVKEKNQNLEGKVIIGDPLKKIEKTEKIEVLLNGENLLFHYDGSESIIQALINEGYEPPYSCLEGTCMTCLGKILKGTVYQDNEGILEEENILAYETLTCQAKGASQFIKLSYDEVD